MGFIILLMVTFGMTMCFMSGAESAPCPSAPVAISITSTDDVQNLHDALACAGEGSFQITWYSSLTIEERIDVSDMKNVTVTGAGVPGFRGALGDDNGADVIIDAGSDTGIFSVSEGSALRLSKLVLEGGNANNGGAVDVTSSSALFAFDCTFRNNNASNGGALFASNSAIYVNGSTSFVDNRGLFGGAIYAEGSNVYIDGNISFGHNLAVGSSTRVNALSISDYSIWSTSSGGAIYVNASAVYIDGDTSFAHNFAFFQGGAIYADESAIWVDGKTDFNNNSAQGAIGISYYFTHTIHAAVGGAMYAIASEVDMDGDTTLAYNFADFGGAIYVSSSEVGIDGQAMFTNNSARNMGGAVYASSSNVSLPGNTGFCSNFAHDQGGAVYVDYQSEIGIDGTAIFTRNSADDGGVIYASSSEVGIDGHATFTNNSARNMGGAIYADSSSVSLHGNAEFYSNHAGGWGGVIYAESSEIGIDGNAIFSNNSADSFGGVIFASSSDIGIDDTAIFTNNSAVEGGAVNAYSSNVTFNGDAKFVNNYADFAEGGAVFASGSKVSFHGNTEFSSNYATLRGGGVAASFGSSIGIHGSSIFTNNAALSDGGAIYVAYESDIGIDGNAIFTKNAAEKGGAVRVFDSEINIDGRAVFTNNSASDSGGAISVFTSNFTVTGIKIRRGDLSHTEGGLYSEAGGDYTSNWSVVFVENSASSLGGAIILEECHQVQVSDVKFESNKAALGGAVYIAAVASFQTRFSACVWENNEAGDGGAVYSYTGPGVDIFTASIFRNNFARTSGGAIFHTGLMRVFNTSFVANQAVVEGPGVMSVGLLEELTNVFFSENMYFCRVGEYGYIEKNETDFCRSCFDEVCSRCSTVGNGEGGSSREQVQINGKPVCADPPLGATAPSRGITVANLMLKKGYFRTSNGSHDILQCFKKSACPGGNDADNYCTYGYTGPYCAVCAKGFAAGIAYSCRECSGDVTRSAVGLAVVVVLAILLFAGLLVSYLGVVVSEGAEEGIETNQSLWKNKCKSCRASLVNILPVRAIKVVVTVWQIITQFDAIAGDVYPELYQTFVSTLTPINLDLEFFFSYSCLFSNDFYDRLLFSTITPLLAFVVLAWSYAVRKRNCLSVSAMSEVRHKHQAAALFVAFFVYSPVSYRIFQTFGCDELDDGEKYLRADYSLSCSTARHSWYKVYAFIMVGVYPIGITAAFAGLIVWHQSDLVKPDREMMLHLQPSKAVWAAYKPSRYYYEVVECGRRIALTVIAAFVLPNSTAQISIALLFVIVYVFISEALSPFEKGLDMGLYRWGNGIIVASMYVAFLMKIDVGQENDNYLLTFSGVLILAHVFMVVTVLVQTVLLAQEVRATKNALRR